MVQKFTGALGVHRAPRDVGPLESEEDLQEKCAKWAAEDIEKLRLLCDHFGISAGPNQYLSLSLELAKEIVPCFKVKAKEGRPRKWSGLILGMLAVEVDRLIDAGETQDSAANIIGRKVPWSTFLESWSDGSSSLGAAPNEAILVAYKAAKKSKFTKIASESFEYHKQVGSIAEWDARVLAIKGNN